MKGKLESDPYSERTPCGALSLLQRAESRVLEVYFYLFLHPPETKMPYQELVKPVTLTPHSRHTSATPTHFLEQVNQRAGVLV